MKRILRWIWRLFLISTVLSALGGVFLYFFWPWVFSWQIWTHVLGLPSFSKFEEYKPYKTSYFFTRGGEILSCVAKPEEWRDALSGGDIDLKNAPIARTILAVEDRRFYERDLAIDLRDIARAAYEDVKELKIVEGGSTIPQQLVKQLLSSEERGSRSVRRKLKELVLASRLIQKFSKDEIFLLYLNEVPFGHQRIGVEAASRLYFNKRAGELSYAEAAVLAGMIHAPARFSPIKHPDMAKAGRDSALKKAFTEGMISESDLNSALAEEIVTSNEFSKSCSRAPHAIDYAREILKNEFGIYFDDEWQNDAWRGIKVRLTLDSELQTFGEEGVRLALEAYRAKYGESAIDAEAAFLAIENGTGAILAMVGGNDFSRRKFNSAVQAKRQTGSAFKPVVYVSKFEQELAEGKPYDNLLDQQITNAYISCKNVKDPKTGQWTYWTPRNFDERKFNAGSYTRRFAIAQSINRPAVWTAQVGKCGLDPRVRIMAKKLGIESDIDDHLPSALGASGISLLELTRAYSVFSNKGILRPAYIISEVSGPDGKIYEKSSWEAKRDCGLITIKVRGAQNKQTKSVTIAVECGISEIAAGVMVEALRGVVKFGTARSLDSLKQPTACKTGTTENYIDAWFMGFTPHITFGAWVGGPESYEKPLGDRATGGSVALPIAKHVLANWYKDSESTPFQEESEEYMKSLVSPKSFEKEVESLKGSDPDVEAPQE